LKFVISFLLKVYCGKSYSAYRGLPTILFISTIVCSGVFFFLILLHSNHILAQDKGSQDYVYKDSNLQTDRQTILFELPSREDILEFENPSVKDSLKRLVEKADFYTLEKAQSVMEKERTPPSGNKHDFLSLAPFHWPDDTKPNGIPYIYRDGETNPEVYTAPDGAYMHNMIEKVKILSAAFYFTKNETYAFKASELLRVWFLNNDTYMNPNLQYAEVITGKNNGTRSGIIAASYLPTILDSVTLIQDSPAWTDKDQRGIELWLNKYLEWLLYSNFGKKESKALNNHGTWYDVQVSSIALFLNKTEITRMVLAKNLEGLISIKIQPNGSQSFELPRSKSLDYHIFNLLGFFNLAKIGDKIDIDLWNYQTPKGSGLLKALNYLLPYALGEKNWPQKQISPIDMNELHDLICEALTHYENNEVLKQAFNSLDTKNITSETNALIFGCVDSLVN
jgi:hypothetical protein